MAHAAKLSCCLLQTAFAAGVFLVLFAAPASSQGLAGPAGRTRIGPGFDCALARDALSGLICGSDRLSWTDLRFSQAYQALRLQVGDSGQSAVRQEAIDFQVRVYAECRLPKVGFVPASFRAEAEACVGNIYELQRGSWVSRLSVPLQEEANRPLPQHLELQAALQKLGYIPAGNAVDGVYGPATRAAIVAWQISRGASPTGFLSAEEVNALRSQANNPQTPAPTTPPVTVSAPPPPAPDEKAVSAAEERRLEIAKAEAAKAKSEADKAQADADRARAEADVFAAKERADAEVRRKAAEQAKAEQDAKGIQP